MSEETDPLIIDLKELEDYLDAEYSGDARTVAAAIAELQRLRDERDALVVVLVGPAQTNSRADYYAIKEVTADFFKKLNAALSAMDAPPTREELL